MGRLGDTFRSRRKFPASAANFASLAILFAVTLATATQCSAQSQTQTAASNSPASTYDVVSIKPTKSATRFGRFINTPDGLTAENITVKELIQRAYGIMAGTDDGRIADGPNWLATERFDIDAKMDGEAAEASQKLNPDALRILRQQMLQGLLANYFKLTINRESRQLQRYTISVAKGGPKLQEATPEEVAANAARVAAGRNAGELYKNVPGGEAFKSFSMTLFVQRLSQLLERPVIDETGLKGLYDFELIWYGPGVGPASAPVPPGAAGVQSAIPSTNDDDDSGVIDAAKKLGLKLDRGKGPVEVIVVTHVERPAEN
ncbi:MAG TPA: TIGR03435 family protein [Candidatus Acidoferrales bacterium]